MNLKSLKREINNNSFPTFGDCDFVDWLNTWSKFCIECINDNDANHCLSEYSHCKHISDINDNLFDGVVIQLEKTRSTSPGSYTIVQDGDTLGELRFRGSNGSA